MDAAFIILPLTLVLGYLFGSIPFGLVLCKLFGYGDIRNIGSGNIGATNVLRTGNKLLALLTLILDSGKGAIAVLVAISFISSDLAGLAAGLGAVLGHIFPVWLKFKGGKGVATSLGTMLAMSPITGAIACLTWLFMALAFRISSLSALTAMLVSPFVALYFQGIPAEATIAVISVIVWIRHKDNISRLLKGEEPKIGKKKDKEQDITEDESKQDAA